MHTVKLKINDDIYNHIMFFLNSLDKKKIEIIENKKNSLKGDQDDILSVGGSLNKYANVSKIDLENSAWESFFAFFWNWDFSPTTSFKLF